MGRRVDGRLDAPPDSVFGLLLRLRLRSMINAVRFGRPAYRRIGVLLGFGAAALFVVVLLVAYALLVGTERVAGPEVQQLLIARTGLFLFLFLLAGAVPFVSSTLFAPADIALLLTSPAPPTWVLLARLLDAVAAASGQFVVIGVPLLFAAGAAIGLSPFGWLIFAILLLLFLALPPLLAATALLALTRLLGLARVRVVVAIVSAALAVGMCLLMVSELAGRAGQIGFDGGSVGMSAVGDVSHLAAQLPRPPAWMPSTWATEALLALGPRGAPWAWAPPLLALFALTALAGLAATELGRRVLLSESLLEADATGGRTGRTSRLESILRVLPFAPATRSFLSKDIRYVVRDLVLLSQIGIPVILFLVPFAIARPAFAQGARSEDLFALSAGIVAFVAFMETSILGLSSVGLEGQAFWLVLSAPISAGAFVRAKFVATFGLSLLLCVPLLLLAAFVFRASPLWVAAGTALLAVSCAALSGLAVGVSGIFPRFVYDNPAHRASLSALIWGFVSATLYAIVTLLALGGAALVGIAQSPGQAQTLLLAAIAFVLLLSTLFGMVPLLWARARLTGYAWED